MGEYRKLTQAEMLAELEDRFGDLEDWAFQCPHCGDIATVRDMAEALAGHPRFEHGRPAGASDLIGQECIGRVLGAVAETGKKYEGRGCGWAAYGLFKGPWEMIAEDGHSVWIFPVAPAPVPAASAEANGA